jgi:hypothetical protein
MTSIPGRPNSVPVVWDSYYTEQDLPHQRLGEARGHHQRTDNHVWRPQRHLRSRRYCDRSGRLAVGRQRRQRERQRAEPLDSPGPDGNVLSRRLDSHRGSWSVARQPGQTLRRTRLSARRSAQASRASPCSTRPAQATACWSHNNAVETVAKPMPPERRRLRRSQTVPPRRRSPVLEPAPRTSGLILLSPYRRSSLVLFG